MSLSSVKREEQLDTLEFSKSLHASKSTLLRALDRSGPPQQL